MRQCDLENLPSKTRFLTAPGAEARAKAMGRYLRLADRGAHLCRHPTRDLEERLLGDRPLLAPEDQLVRCRVSVAFDGPQECASGITERDAVLTVTLHAFGRDRPKALL